MIRIRRVFQQLAVLARTRRAVAAVLFITAGVLFLGLASIARSPVLLGIDQGLTRWAQATRSPLADSVALGITHLGDPEALILVALAAAASLGSRGQRRAALLCGASLLGLPLNSELKLLVHRPRPVGDAVTLLTHISGTSFPSGHTMGATAVYGVLAFLAYVHLAEGACRRRASALLAAVPVLVGMSRVYLGAHWSSDVLGGWAAGACFVFLLTEIYHVATAAHAASPSAPPLPSAAPATHVIRNPGPGAPRAGGYP